MFFVGLGDVVTVGPADGAAGPKTGYWHGDVLLARFAGYSRPSAATRRRCRLLAAARLLAGFALLLRCGICYPVRLLSRQKLQHLQRNGLDIEWKTWKASACRNIAEGFARYGHAEFAHFVSIARGSLGELRDSMDEASLKRYITTEEWDELDRAIRSAMSSASALRRYLLRIPTPESRRQSAKPKSNSQPRSGE